MVKIALAADQATVHSGKLPLLVPHATLSPAREMSPSARAIPARLEKTKTGAGPLRIREIARRLRRSPSTISRELRRNAGTRSGTLAYRATTA